MVIDKSSALDIARNRAREQGWAFLDPVQVDERRGWFSQETKTYFVRSNAGRFGAIARFTIDARTGQILSEGYVPR